MIFSPALSRKISRGEKHQTRRPVKHDPEHGTPKPCRYKAGKTYAVQPGRGEKAVTHIRIAQVRRERVGRITDEEARAEGFKSRAEFASYWMRLYDRDWPPLEEVDCEHCDEQAVIWDPGEEEWVECPHCELGVAKVEASVPDSEILDRFDRRHGQTEVWVITFERTDDRPLFLMAGSPPVASGKARVLSPDKVTPRPHREPPLTEDEARGYAEAASMAIDNAEVVSGSELEEMAARSRQAWAAGHLDRERDREGLELEERLRRVRQAARDQGIDIHRREAALLQRIRALENQVLRRAA